MQAQGNLMKLPRRQFLHLAAGLAALPAVSRIPMAQAYPSRPVRLVVPFGSAGATDITARLVGQWLSERLGQQFIIENRPGAGGNVGTEAVVRASPDGYTLLMASTTNAINATLYDKLSFNFIRDIAPVASIIRFPNIMVVNPSVPAKTLPEFIAYAKSNPGKINMASSGIGTGPHIFGELFKMMAGVNLVHVPYRSIAAAMTDLVSGQVQIMSVTTGASNNYVKAGTLRALAVTSLTRLEELPNIPAVGEVLSGYEASIWFGIGAPKATPAEIVGKLNKQVNAGLDDPKLKRRLIDLGGTLLAGSPADFGKLLADETEKWGNVIQALNIKAD
jgi:tripartite-type tricarboxylate transporter receptor subunit TctC